MKFIKLIALLAASVSLASLTSCGSNAEPAPVYVAPAK